MAGLDDLLPHIYHETQQSGSMLCAQHALNSLLQGNYFTAPDLSELARHLDVLEQSYNEDIRGHASANMDDTGFFSVQVLENALRVWGLSLVRWRSEAMRPYHDQPHTQLAFVLNQSQHWYTLRRFGVFGKTGHWFNLDSNKPFPQWVSETYLGMFIQQAEHDGYSVFVVVPIDPSTSDPLPRTDADDLASTIPGPSTSSSAHRLSSSEPGFEDEDMELQAALQASLSSTEQGSGSSSRGTLNRLENYPPPAIPSSRSFAGSPPESISRRTTGGGSDIPPNQDQYGNADVDLVTASMERNRVIMERMRQEQEAALREQYNEEAIQFGQAQERHPRQRRESEEGEEDEDSLFRKAMEESLAEHRARGGAGTPEEPDMGDESEVPAARPDVRTMHRVYDDDDAELQAALKASLETTPPGFSLPSTTPPPPPQRLTNVPIASAARANRVVEDAGAEAGTETETETETETDAEGAGVDQTVKEEVSLEEMRRRRLARFGG